MVTSAPPLMAQPVSGVPSEARWSVPLAAPPAAEPIVADGLVVLPLRSGHLVAHRISDGVEAWRIELAAERPLASLGGLIFAAAGEAVHALRAADRTVMWRTPTGTLTAPILAQDGWIIAAGETGLMALRASDGSVVWRTAATPQSERASLEGDRVFVPSADGTVRALDLATGTERWRRRLGGAPTEVLAFSDRVYAGSADKHFYCLDANNGAIVWRYRVGAGVRGKPASDGPRIFAVALDNGLRAFDRGHGARRWEESVPYRPMTGPLVIGTSIVVPGPDREIPVIEAASGDRKDKLVLGATLAMPLAQGSDGGTPVFGAVTGDITVGWTLSLLQPVFGVRVITLTSLPGELVPLAPPVK